MARKRQQEEGRGKRGERESNKEGSRRSADRLKRGMCLCSGLVTPLNTLSFFAKSTFKYATLCHFKFTQYVSYLIERKSIDRLDWYAHEA